MADNYNLSYTRSQVDTAIGRALNPDTTPTSGHTTKLVTSHGVAAKISELSDSVNTQVTQIGLNLSDLTQRSNKFLRLAVMIDSTNGILSIGGKRYKLIPTTDTPTWDLDYNDFVTKSTIESEEWAYLLTDSENRILYGIDTNGYITDNSSIVEGATVGGFDVIAIINNYAATYNYD